MGNGREGGGPTPCARARAPASHGAMAPRVSIPRSVESLRSSRTPAPHTIQESPRVLQLTRGRRRHCAQATPFLYGQIPILLDLDIWTGAETVVRLGSIMMCEQRLPPPVPASPSPYKSDAPRPASPYRPDAPRPPPGGSGSCTCRVTDDVSLTCHDVSLMTCHDVSLMTCHPGGSGSCT